MRRGVTRRHDAAVPYALELTMPTPSARRLLPIVVAYLPLPIIGAILSFAWNVGASPEGAPTDVFLLGSPLTPPLFLPVLLVGSAAAARREGLAGRMGAGFVSLVSVAFLAGSTLNLPNDFKAAEAAGTPIALSAVLAAIHIGLALSLLFNAVPRLVRGRRDVTEPAPAGA
jgi:hypothetical protein